MAYIVMAHRLRALAIPFALAQAAMSVHPILFVYLRQRYAVYIVMAYIGMALHSHGPIWLWPYIVMALYSNGPI